MKQKTLSALFMGVLALASCKKPNVDPVNPGPIDIEKEYTELYALGASVGKWDSMDPEPMWERISSPSKLTL